MEVNFLFFSLYLFLWSWKLFRENFWLGPGRWPPWPPLFRFCSWYIETVFNLPRRHADLCIRVFVLWAYSGKEKSVCYLNLLSLYATLSSSSDRRRKKQFCRRWVYEKKNKSIIFVDNIVASNSYKVLVVTNSKPHCRNETKLNYATKEKAIGRQNRQVNALAALRVACCFCGKEEGRCVFWTQDFAALASSDRWRTCMPLCFPRCASSCMYSTFVCKCVCARVCARATFSFSICFAKSSFASSSSFPSSFHSRPLLCV